MLLLAGLALVGLLSARGFGRTSPLAELTSAPAEATHAVLPLGPVPSETDPGAVTATPQILALHEERAREYNLEELAEAAALLRHIKMRMNYPLWTQPLARDDVWKPASPYRGQSNDPTGPKLYVWPEKAEYTPGETIRVFAAATRSPGGDRAPIETASGETAESAYGHAVLHPAVPFTFHGDADAGDGSLTAVVPVGGTQSIGEWLFTVRAVVDGHELSATSGFQVNGLDGVLTGGFHQAIEEKSLVLYAELNVLRPSFQHLRAELWEGDEPIASAWHAERLTGTGVTVFRLVFYGKILRDSGHDGPYVIRNAVLTTDGDQGRFAGPAVDPVLTTPAYLATDFTDAPKNGDNALLREQWRLALDDLGRAQRGEFDPSHPAEPRTTSIDKWNTPAPE